MNDLIRWQPNKLITENHEGKLIQSFYKEILELPPTTMATNNNNNKNIRTKSKQYKKQKKLLDKFNKKYLFQAAVNNDIDLLKSMEITSENVNELDTYGWTALMIASAAGSIHVVKYLLVELNANVHVTDKAGNNAYSLANAKNHTNILKVFNEYFGKSESTTTVQQKFDNNDDFSLNNKFEPFYCESCEQTFYETTRKQHETSTVHKFNTIDGYKFSKRYHLPDSNRGFQMLLNLGWNRESGLGPDGKKGLLYPIRTTLRTHRSGLGLPQKGIGCGVPRITHFSAYDLNAIKCRRRQNLLNNSNNSHFKTKKQIKNELQKDKRKEILLRNELS